MSYWTAQRIAAREAERKAAGAVLLVILGFLAVFATGYIANIVYLVRGFTELAAMTITQIISAIGIVMFPLGWLMGYLQMFGVL